MWPHGVGSLATMLFAGTLAFGSTDQNPQSPTPKNELATRYLKVLVGPSDGAAAPGGRLTLSLDVTPGPKIHVYAPGQTGYIAISLKLPASTDFKAAPARFPPSEPYFFAPTNESLKVYAKSFQIAQEITLARTPTLRQRAAAKETLVIAGTLEYQACDDLVCYRPDSLPVSWKIALVPVGRGFSPGNVAGPEGPAYTRGGRQPAGKPR